MKIQVLVLAAALLLVGLLYWERPAESEEVLGAAPVSSSSAAPARVVLQETLSDPVAEVVRVPAKGQAELSAEPEQAVTTAPLLAPAKKEGPAVSGRVLTAEGVPVPAALVRYALDAGGSSAVTTTDRFGGFQLAAHPGGSVELRVVPARNGSRRGSAGTAPLMRGTMGMEHNMVQLERVFVEAGGPPVTIRVGSAGAIAGRVLLHPEHGDMGLAVVVTSGKAGQWNQPATLKEDGSFLIEGLLGGSYGFLLKGSAGVLFEVPGISVSLGEVTRDPRLRGIHLDSLFVQTLLIGVDPNGNRLDGLNITALNGDGQLLSSINTIKQNGRLTLPRAEAVTIRVGKSGFRPRSVVITGEKEVRVTLELGIRVRLRALEARPWAHAKEHAVASWLADSESTPGVTDEFGDVAFGLAGIQQAELEVIFPGPGRYELGIVKWSWTGGTQRGEPTNFTRTARRLGVSLVIAESDEGSLKVIDLPVDLPSDE
ncbi:MAG: hypothetical protein ACI8QC_003440 [Planctomycetota bacterium]|jgi:hypothetical protein